jgi:hypothetical protein
VQFGHVRNGEGGASHEERHRDHVDRRCGLDEGNLAGSEHVDDEDLCYKDVGMTGYEIRGECATYLS